MFKPLEREVGYYHMKDGKRCKHCECYIQFSGARCPCCNFLLRTTPHKKKYRQAKQQRAREFDDAVEKELIEHFNKSVPISIAVVQ